MSLTDLARPNIRALKPYASARALANSAGVLLNANENPWPPAGDNGQALNRYPEPQPERLCRKMADYFDVDTAQLLVTRGSDEGIDLLVRAFCEPGQDRVMINTPCFGMYSLSARIQNAEVIDVPLVEVENSDNTFDWQLDLPAMAAAPACKLVFLCSPNNPTGNQIPVDTVIELARARREQGLVIIDEAYIEFADQPSLISRLAEADNLVVMRTLSKAFGLAGCRIGAVIAHPEVIGLLRRIIPPYPLPTPSVTAALQALENGQDWQTQVATLNDQKAELVAFLQSLPAVRRLWPGTANFVLLRVDDGPSLVAQASEAGIRLRDQSSQPGLEHCVRISIGTPEENQTLMTFLKEWAA
ncbi:MAG: histidinol-phosphate transaminase [Wenzhouxiangella sp.]